jgi:hypothetical protein
MITTGTNPKAMWPGINAWWGAAYNEKPAQWTDLVEQHTSEMMWEEDVGISGFPLAQIKPSGKGITYADEHQGYISRYTHIVWSLGYIVSWEEMLNNLYEQVAKRRTQRLAFSMRQTKEWNVANIYNRAFSNSYLGGDGVCLCSASHPTSAGLQSNVPSSALDICELGIEDMMVKIGTATNDMGHPVGLIGQSLIVPWQLFYEANRILESVLQNDTANNAINALRTTNALPQGIKVNNYLTDADNYFIRTDCPDGVKLFQRYPLTFDEDNDFDTKNQKYAAVDYYSVGWSDWRQVYGSNPA